MTFNANLSKTYWPYVPIMATSLKNMCFSSAIGKTHCKFMYGEKSSLNFVKTFGCVAYSFVENQFRKNLDKISKRGIFLGTLENSQAYLIGIKSEGKLKVQKSRNVSFDKSKFSFEKILESDEWDCRWHSVFWRKSQNIYQKRLRKLWQTPNGKKPRKKSLIHQRKTKFGN